MITSASLTFSILLAKAIGYGSGGLPGIPALKQGKEATFRVASSVPGAGMRVS